MRLWSHGGALDINAPIMGRLTRKPLNKGRGDSIALCSDDSVSDFGGDWSGYAGALVRVGSEPTGVQLPRIINAPHLDYLDTGDVVQLLPSGIVRVLYRRSSQHNTILMTEQCNSLCLMCSQPPKAIDDSYRVNEILRLLDLVDPETRELGLSGGEPTLLGDSFFRIIDKARRTLPHTALHILTNGRRFKDRMFANGLRVIDHPDLVLGIPLYSDVDWRHDHVVQAKGAYDETLAGLYNLAAAGVRIEIRVVLHALTTERLPHLAEFIARNLPFVEHVALMGLEMFGFTPRNLGVLWIDPFDYQKELEAATRKLARAGLRVSIYNHQLCTLPLSLWPYAVKSISDWKNIYLPQCGSCGVRELCGGFFQSATKRHSAHIHPQPPVDDGMVNWLNRWWEVEHHPVSDALDRRSETERPHDAGDAGRSRRMLPIAESPVEKSATARL